MSQQFSDSLERIDVKEDCLELRFKVTLKASSLESSAFLLESNDSTPVTYTFKPINLAEHYNSLTRTLRIFFSEPIPQGTYTLFISGLKTVNGSILPNEELTINYEFEQEGQGEDCVYKVDKTIRVLDKSIRREAFIVAETIKASNPYFFIVGTDPQNDSIFVEPDYKRGRISITFSDRPSPQFLNSQFIKVQRKNMRRVGRWETLSVSMSVDSFYPTVYIYVPALQQQATPIYNTEGYDYYEDNYKYRVRLSKEIGV